MVWMGALYSYIINYIKILFSILFVFIYLKYIFFCGSSLCCRFTHHICYVVCDGARTASLGVFGPMYSDNWCCYWLETRWPKETLEWTNGTLPPPPPPLPVYESSAVSFGHILFFLIVFGIFLNKEKFYTWIYQVLLKSWAVIVYKV